MFIQNSPTNKLRLAGTARLVLVGGLNVMYTLKKKHLLLKQEIHGLNH